ncbi:hypothetical protein GE061_016865 [Apolygus lucorum]|uniref:Uncharacterized protein n=1 Tax=Apolygus lucorum TaxID=248454 RepID=A0A8S9XII0_APOLU|nr:hypothetical protein GE061_016865 [Apolygus lucorum]
MMPISSPKHIGEKTYQAKNDGGGIKNIDLQYSDISKIAHIKSKVQEALKGMIFPPKYSQKHADVVAKREKQVEQILQEKLRRASKSIKNNIREVRHVDPARASSSQKLYAPKCPSRLMFGGHPDSRVITFNNVREFDAPRVATDRIPRSGVEDHTLNIVPSEVEEPTDKSTGVEEKETTEKYQPAAQQYIVQNHVHGSDKVKQKNTGNYLPFAQHYIEQNSASDSDKPNPAVNEHYEWDRKEDLSPSTNQDYVQNLPSVQLNSAAALPFSTNEYWKHAIERHTLRANRNEAALQKLEYIIKQRSKKVTTPGSIRLARLNDPKYGMTSPNRLRFDR